MMDRSPKINELFLPSGCLTGSGLLFYLEEKLGVKEMQLAKRHVEECEFCRIAMAGLQAGVEVDSIPEINLRLHGKIDLLVERHESPVFRNSSSDQSPGLKQMLFHMFRLRNIAAILPLLFLLGSVMWLTAALQVMDQRISGLSEFSKHSEFQEEVPEELAEFIQHQETLKPPAPVIREFVIQDADPLPEEDLLIEAGDEFVIEHHIAMPQFPDVAENENEIFVVVEEPPRFPGGHDALLAYLAENLRYPLMARQENIQGTVYLTFVIGKNGKVEDTKVLRGLHPSIDAEAVRVIKGMPEWIPGRQRGTAVSVQFTMPVRFSLE